jgi:hypothetical protein
MEEISWGEKVLVSPKYSTSTTGLPPWSTTLNGQDSMSFLTIGSSNRLPIRRLQCPLESTFLGTAISGQTNILLNIENSVLWVHGSLILSGLANKALLVGKGDKRRCGVASLFIGNWIENFVRISILTAIIGVI